MPSDKAFTSTPDPQQGSPIDVVTGTTDAGTVERQRIVLADPQFQNPDVRPTERGALPVDGSRVTQPVSIEGLPVPVDGSSVTQPIRAESLPLPLGAALETGNLAAILAKLVTNLAVLMRGVPTGDTTLLSGDSVVLTGDLGVPSSGAAQPTYGTVLGVPIDPRLIRALTAADVVTLAPLPTLSVAQSGNWTTASVDASGSIEDAARRQLRAKETLLVMTAAMEQAATHHFWMSDGSRSAATDHY